MSEIDFPTSKTEPIGLIAGGGRFPLLFAQKAKQLGIPIVCVGVRGMTDKQALLPHVRSFYWSRLGSMGRPISCFKREGVKRWTMAGKIHKTTLLKPWLWLTLLPDWRMIRFLWFRRRKDNADDTLTLGLIQEFENEGLKSESALNLCPELLVRPGILTKRKLTSKEEEDIRYGWTLAKEMGRLDIGQSVSVRQ